MKLVEKKKRIFNDEMLDAAASNHRPYALYVYNEEGLTSCVANTRKPENLSCHVMIAAFRMLSMEQKIGMIDYLKSELKKEAN